jgi:hypothetical protein
VKTFLAAATVGLLFTQAHPATVRITAPANGATVTSPVTITLTATGVRIAPASDEKTGSTHHHLFVDHDLTWLNDTIPQGSPGIYHLARGQKEFTLDLKPGPHRVIALLAHWNHVPLNPLVADTVTFTVK